MPEPELDNVKLRLEPFLSRLLKSASLEVRFQVLPGSGQIYVTGTPDIVVTFDGANSDLLLQRGGELLDALEHLCLEYLQLPSAERHRIAFDCQEYRALRLEELRLTAATAAESVERSGRPFALNPMNSRERRIIHLALQENPAVRTESEGIGPHRKVVIYPAQKNNRK
ncbi:MAG: single-stranded DNA-binding protein [Acidobacteria bacterium]|nr:single-stranded DNA-binding protein [Acidobacteriota bacterium]